MAKARHDADEVAVARRRGDAEPVEEPERPEGGDEARRPRAVAVHQHLVARGVGPQERHHRVEHRQLHVLAAVTALAGEQRGGDGLRGGERGDLVGRGLAEEHRDAVGRIGLVGAEPAVGLDHRVVGRLAGVRADRAEPGQRHVDEVVVTGAQVVVAEAVAVEGAGPEVLHEHVGVLRESAHDVAALVGAARRPRCSASRGCTPA